MDFNLQPVLVADTDAEFRNMLNLRSQDGTFKSVFVGDGIEFENIMTKSAQRFSGIFINPNVINPYGVPAIKATLQYRPNTPIFYLMDKDTPEISQQTMKGLSIRGALKKPLGTDDIIRVILDQQVLFDPKDALKQTKLQDKLEVETQANDADFTAILAANFLSGSTCVFEVYIRLAPNRYVKILQAGDAFQKDRLQGYLDKGVQFFFLRNEAQQFYLKFCDHVATSLIQNKAIPAAVKVTHTLNHGQVVLGFMQKTGVSPELIQSAQQFSGNVRSLINRLDEDNNGVISEHLFELANYEHAVGATMIAALIAPHLKFEGERSIRIIGVATLMHDIGLSKMDSKFGNEEEGKLTEEELKIYQTHPAVGAEIIASIKGVDPTVAQAVLQHHERRSRKGFPHKLGSGQINRVAEIVGIADEFMKLLIKAKASPHLNPLDEMEVAVFNGFSAPIVESFRKAFKRKK